MGLDSFACSWDSCKVALSSFSVKTFNWLYFIVFCCVWLLALARLSIIIRDRTGLTESGEERMESKSEGRENDGPYY